MTLIDKLHKLGASEATIALARRYEDLSQPWTAPTETQIELVEERDMAEAYYKSLEAHLRVHGCDHGFDEIANGDAEVTQKP